MESHRQTHGRDLPTNRQLQLANDSLTNETDNPGVPPENPNTASASPNPTPDSPPSIKRNGTDPAQPSGVHGPSDTPEAKLFKPPLLPVDPLRLILAVIRRFYFPIIAGALGALAFFLLGSKLFEPSYSASVQLIRKQIPAAAGVNAFQPKTLGIETVEAMMRSRPLLTEVSVGADFDISPSELRNSLQVTVEKKTDLVLLTLSTGHSLEETVQLVNQFAESLIRHLSEIQTNEARELVDVLQKQVSNAEREIRSIDIQLQKFTDDERFLSGEKQMEAYLSQLGDINMRLEQAKSRYHAIGLQITNKQTALLSQNPLADELKTQQTMLENLLRDYTEDNILVIAQQKRVDELLADVKEFEDTPPPEQELTGTLIGNSLYLDLLSLRADREALEREIPRMEELRTNLETNLYGLPKKAQQYATIEARRVALVEMVKELESRHREAALFANNPFRSFEIYSSANEKSAETHSPIMKTVAVSIVGGGMGFSAVVVLLIIFEVIDRRVISPSDTRRVTQLPTLLGLAKLSCYSEAHLAEWAIKAWNTLRSAYLGDDTERLAVFFTSSSPQDGRSTWVRLLGKSARDCALPILIISNEDPPPDDASIITAPLGVALDNPKFYRSRLIPGQSQCVYLTWTDIEEWPLINPERILNITDAAFELGLEACLVELPPLDNPKSLSLVRALPNVIWMTRSAKLKTTEARRDRQRLEAVGAELSAAVLNEQPRVFNRIPDLGKFGLIVPLILSIQLPLFSQESGLPEATGVDLEAALERSLEQDHRDPKTNGVAPPIASQETNDEFPEIEIAPKEEPEPARTFQSSPVDFDNRAQWQQRYELGPGDAVDIWVYGRDELVNRNLVIQADGRLTFFYVKDLMVAGLTVDELRERLNEELANYVPLAQAIVVPVNYASKRYYVLGAVQDNGSYVLDRPTTIIEAVGKARGMQTGLFNRNTVDLADLGRSMLVRDGALIDVDFERLFYHGDMTQNHYLEPGDYLYFPSSSLNQIYLVGEVVTPGTVGVSGNTTVVSVITNRGGFTPNAFKQRVLVIRGSLTDPETHVVNVDRILRGGDKDFRLQPKDIVYVGSRPWRIADELIDIAIKAYLTGATAEWTGQNIELIEDAFIPGNTNR